MSKARVFGIGLTRTGTTSLNSALCTLGWNARHWPPMAELFSDAVPEAATDETVSVVYKYLDVRFPGSKFILTVRDEEPWLRSVERHRERFGHEVIEQVAAVQSVDVRRFADDDPVKVIRSLDRWLGQVRPYAAAVHARFAVDTLFSQTYLYGAIAFDRARFAEARRRHHEDVAAHFRDRPGDLLTLDVTKGAGWDPLCKFLDRPVPDRPFPHDEGGRAASAP